PEPIAGLTIGSGANTKDTFRPFFSGLSLLVSVLSDLSVPLRSTGEACAEGFVPPSDAAASREGELLDGADSCTAHCSVRYGLKAKITKGHARTMARKYATWLDITTRSWCNERLRRPQPTVRLPSSR